MRGTENVIATGVNIALRDSSGVFSGQNLYISQSTGTFLAAGDQPVYITGGYNILTSGSANVTGDMYAVSGGVVHSTLQEASNISFVNSSGTITANTGQVFVTGSTVNISGHTSYITGAQVLITSGYNVLSGIGISITGGTNSITNQSGNNVYVTGGVTSVTLESGTPFITGGVVSTYNQIFNGPRTLEDGGVNSGYMAITGDINYISGGVIQSITGNLFTISGQVERSNTISQILTDSATIYKGLTTITQSSGIEVAAGATVQTITDNTIENFTLQGGDPMIIKGTNLFSDLTGNIYITGSQSTSITGGYVGITGLNLILNNTDGIVNITGQDYTINSTGTVYITGSDITGFVTINDGFITGSTVTITGDGTTYVSGGEIDVRSTNAQINQLKDSILQTFGAANIENSDVSMLSVGTSYVSGTTVTISSRPGSTTNITGANIDLDSYGVVSINNSQDTTATGTSIYITDGTSQVSGTYAFVTGVGNYITGADVG